MKKIIADISQRKAAIVVGMAMIISAILAFIVDDLILPNFIRPGDIAALAKDIEANVMLFGIAAIIYLMILICDVSISLGLYVIFKPVNKNLAVLTAVLRLLYVAFAVVGLLALAFRIIDVYSYETIKLIGYIFFVGHLFVTGYTVFKAKHIPWIFGVLLIIASFCYVVFFVTFPESLLLIMMLCMAAGEMSLDIWLLIKSSKLADMLEKTMKTSKE